MTVTSTYQPVEKCGMGILPMRQTLGITRGGTGWLALEPTGAAQPEEVASP